MGIIGTIVIGLVVGLLARFFMPGRDPMGSILTAVLGIVGAALGGWVGYAMGLYREGEPAGFIMSVIGAMIVLFLYRLIAPRNRATPRI
ncbi:MAG: GlsB/YeaQ/YmgE family stress response membrane protein [Bdellovibrionales bacterium]